MSEQEYIKIEFSWEAAARIHTEILINGAARGKGQAARDDLMRSKRQAANELIRMAKAYDATIPVVHKLDDFLKDLTEHGPSHISSVAIADLTEAINTMSATLKELK